MRITYITHTRFPTEKAHGNQVAQVCHALAQLGHEVTLLAPTVRNVITQSAHAYYGLSQSFRVEYPGSFDALGSKLVPGKLGFMVSMWSYRRALKKYLRTHPSDLLYVRSPSLLEPLLKTGTPVFLELHGLARFGKRRLVKQCNRCFRVICLTSLLKSALLTLSVDPLRVTVEADGVDLERFSSLPRSSEAKKAFGIPADVPVVGYAGSLLARNTIEKGVGELVGAVARLKSQGRTLCGLIVGGAETERARYQEQAEELGLTSEDIRFTGRVPAAEVPAAIAAFDVCVYPAPASMNPFFLRDTSPLKLFEYLASGRPIACADLPPLRDVVDESSVRFCKPGDAESLANAIQWILEHREEAEKMAEKGKRIAAEHAWVERMKRIVGGLTASIPSPSSRGGRGRLV